MKIKTTKKNLQEALKILVAEASDLDIPRGGQFASRGERSAHEIEELCNVLQKDVEHIEKSLRLFNGVDDGEVVYRTVENLRELLSKVMHLPILSKRKRSI